MWYLMGKINDERVGVPPWQTNGERDEVFLLAGLDFQIFHKASNIKILLTHTHTPLFFNQEVDGLKKYAKETTTSYGKVHYTVVNQDSWLPLLM